MIRSETRGHVAIVTMDNPPVNALPVAGWFALADAIPGARIVGVDDGHMACMNESFAAPLVRACTGVADRVA